MKQLIKVDHKEFGLKESKASEIKKQFQPMLDRMKELEEEANEIFKLDLSDKEAGLKAKELRLKYVKVRTGTAAIHKEQKAFYRKGGLYVDGWKNAQLFAAQGVEEKLLEYEKHQENLEREAIEKLQEERAEKISKFLPEETEVPSHLGDMDEEMFEMYLSGSETKHKEKAESEKKAQEERLKAERLAEKKRKEEEEKVALYNSRKNDLINFNLWNYLKEDLKSCDFSEISQEQYQIIYDEALVFKVAEEKRLKLQEKENEKLRKQAKEQEKKDAEKKRLADAKLKEEQEARKKAEKELEDKNKAEEKEKKDEENRLQAELNKGDAAKVRDLLKDLQELKTKYSFKSVKNKSKYNRVGLLLDKIVEDINS